MPKESIEYLNEWFADEERFGETYRTEDGQYVVSPTEMNDFCDYLNENEIDLIGIPCMVGPSGIWFKCDDLENANYY